MSRPNKLQSQLEAALRDAETATRADISVQKLIQTRLTILNKIAGRQHSAKVRKLKEEVTRLRIENGRLTADLTAARADLQRIQTINRPQGFGSSLDEKLKAIEVDHYKMEETCKG